MIERLIILLLIAFQSLLTNAQEFRFGLYMRDTLKEIHQINPTVIADKNVNALFMPFFEKPTMTVYVDKRAAQITTDTNKPEFFFFMSNTKESTSLSLSELSSVIKNYPFIYAESAEDFILVRLFDMKRGRAFRLEKEKVIYGANFKIFDEDKIEYNVIPIPEENAFKIEINQSLPKGEYGFILNKPTPYDMVIYDFRIE